MRVAFDVGPVRAQPSGVGLFATALANALAAQLPAGDLVLIGASPQAAGLPVDVPSVSARQRSYLVWMQRHASTDVRRAACDIAHYSDGVIPVVRAGPTVLSVHDMSILRMWRAHPMRRWLRIPLVVSSPRLADVVVVPSKATADEVMRYSRLSARRIEVLPYAPQDQVGPASPGEIAATLARLGLPKRGFVLSVGTIEPRKNHVRLVEAFEQAISAQLLPKDALLVIAGQPGWRHGPILERIRCSSMAGQIRLLGYVASADLAGLYGGCAVAAYVSLYEGFGLPVVEAMAHGAATVTSSVSSMPEVAGDAGYLADPRSAPSIARALGDAWADQEADPERVSGRARARSQTFSWTRVAAGMREIYRDCTMVGET